MANEPVKVMRQQAKPSRVVFTYPQPESVVAAERRITELKTTIIDIQTQCTERRDHPATPEEKQWKINACRARAHSEKELLWMRQWVNEHRCDGKPVAGLLADADPHGTAGLLKRMLDCLMVVYNEVGWDTVSAEEQKLVEEVKGHLRQLDNATVRR